MEPYWAGSIKPAKPRGPNVGKPRKTAHQRYLRHIEKTYGITEEQYLVMVEIQLGRCAICNQEGHLVVDHDHDSGKVRGLLCDKCNHGLHYIELDGFLEKASHYIRQHLTGQA